MNATPNRRHRPALAGLAVALVLAVSTATLGSPAARAVTLVVPSGLGQLLTTYDGAAVVRGIAEFGSVPGAAQVAALEGLGLVVQPMQHVPLALVAGPVASMEAAVATGAAEDVYPDEPIELLDTASSDAMGAAPPARRRASPARA